MGMRRPRIFERLYAWLRGYYWGPCPICGRHFGGHERGGYLATSFHGGRRVCAGCVDEADRLNEANNWFIPESLPVPLVSETIKSILGY
jgi:hypothetical protein